uniref:ASCH domain-containing protein n=1 Tax=Fagus sylvatica TaxID=28930 RepID=A0A2N9F073_FAGSY
MRGGNSSWNYRNPCLTMHQPWASLLVHGIKRIEGRSWPSPIRGRLWIHAGSKVPDEATIKAMEDFYREIYAVNGITDLKFPDHYPVSRLLGCVEVVGCVRGEELASWEMVPEGVRLEGLTDFCWLCEQPQKLLIPFEMRGYQRVYNLEKKIYDAAVRALVSVEGPQPVKFPLPNPRDPFSLKPGSISVQFPESKASHMEKSSTLSAAIAGARAAATQFTKKDENFSRVIQNSTPNTVKTGQSKRESLKEDAAPDTKSNERSNYGILASNDKEQSVDTKCEGSSSRNETRAGVRHTGAPSKFKVLEQIVKLY